MPFVNPAIDMQFPSSAPHFLDLNTPVSLLEAFPISYLPVQLYSVRGIVAGRIKDRYYHPTILITDAEDGAKGSARSIEGYHIFEELFACRDLFTRFGGHAMAAGLSLPKENIPLLRQRLNTACQLTEAEMTPRQW